MLGGSAMLGMTLGAVTGGRLMQIGRRKSMFILLVIGVAGNLITINIDSFPMLLTGRFLYGFASGSYTSIVPKMMEETLPNHLFSTIIATFCCSQTLATLVAFLLGAILPPDDDKDALIATHKWLVFYVYVPIGI